MDPTLLATLVRRVHLAIRAEILDYVHDRGYADLTPPQVYVLQSPGPDGLGPTELAQRTLMTKQALNHVLARMEAGGYLERHDSDHDARARVVRLTDRGRDVTRLLVEASAMLQDRWTELIGAERMEALVATLADLDEHVAAERDRAIPQVGDAGTGSIRQS
jgi:DNA-binding MarR family transcriptional regulator